MAKVKLAFAGVGFMGQLAHLENYMQIPDCEVVAVADARTDMAARVASNHGIPRVYPEISQMLESETVDGYVCVQQYKANADILPQIIRKGKPLMTEKPLCLSVENGQKLLALEKVSGCVHMMGYHKRSDPATEYAVKVIRQWQSSGEYGKLRYIRSSMPPGYWQAGKFGFVPSNMPYPQNKLEDYAEMAYFDEKTAKQYDFFVNYYIHQVNLMRFLAGEDYAVVSAPKSGVLLVGETPSGVCCSLEMAAYQLTSDWQESAIACFEKGFVRIDLPAPLATSRAGTVTIMRDNGKDLPSYVSPILPTVSAMRNQAQNFVNLCTGTGTAPATSEDGLQDLQVARDYMRMLRGL